MSGFLYSVGGFIVALGILVAVHEFGHYWVAKTLGVKVLRFSIGFGKILWSKKRGPDNTEYALGAIPLGGYVKMLDESDGDVDPNEAHRAFNRQGLMTRVAVVLAGPAFNFLFAIAVYWLVSCIGVEGVKPVVGTVAEGSIASQAGIEPGDEIVSVDGRSNRSWGENRLHLFDAALSQRNVPVVLKNDSGIERTVQLDLSSLPASRVDAGLIENGIGMRNWLPDVEAQIAQVVENSPAERAGLKPGDRVLGADGESFANWDEFVRYVQPRANKVMELDIDRDGESMMIEVTPEPREVDGKTFGRVGIGPVIPEFPDSMRVNLRAGPIGGFFDGVENTWLMSKLSVAMLWRMLKLEVSPKNISGPVTIARYAGQTAQIGIDSFLNFLAVVSISLGILNLLPIPVLDGGHLMYYLIEAVKGSPLSDEVLIWGQQIGILLLGALMCLAFYNDIWRLLQ